MKLGCFFGLVVLALAVQQNDARVSIKNAVVKELTSINSRVGHYVSEANHALLKLIQSETPIDEKDVKRQVELMTKLINRSFALLNIVGKGMKKELVACIVAEEPSFLAAVQNVTEQFGLCNSKLDLDLTVALQELTAQWVEKNVHFKKVINKLNKCKSPDVVCLGKFVNEVTVYVQKDLLQDEEFGAAYKSVEKVLKDIRVLRPDCAKTQYLPEIRQAVQQSRENVKACLQK